MRGRALFVVLSIVAACGGKVAQSDDGDVTCNDCGSPGSPPSATAVPTSTSTSSPPSKPPNSDAGSPATAITDDDCDGPANTLVLSGQPGDFVHPGYVKITDGSWSGGGDISHISLYLDPANEKEGLWWTLDFSTEKLGGPILPDVLYSDAERYPFEDTNHPGMTIAGDGRGCNEDFGSFTISELAMSGSTLTHLRATFEQHCESKTAPTLWGCVKLDQPAPDAGP